MTALEYMEKQVRKHCSNYIREFTRGVSDEVLNNIMSKIICYVAACDALRKVSKCERKDNDSKG